MSMLWEKQNNSRSSDKNVPINSKLSHFAEEHAKHLSKDCTPKNKQEVDITNTVNLLQNFHKQNNDTSFERKHNKKDTSLSGCGQDNFFTKKNTFDSWDTNKYHSPLKHDSSSNLPLSRRSQSGNMKIELPIPPSQVFTFDQENKKKLAKISDEDESKSSNNSSDENKTIYKDLFRFIKEFKIYIYIYII